MNHEAGSGWGITKHTANKFLQSLPETTKINQNDA